MRYTNKSIRNRKDVFPISVFEVIHNNAMNNPNKIVCMDEKSKITAKQLLYIILNSKEILKNEGIEREDVVLLNCKNTLHFVLCLFCLFYNQNWVVPLSNKMLPEEMSHILQKTNAKQLTDECINKIVHNEETNISEFSIPDNEATGIYHLTSGTTDMSKLCVRSLKNLEAEGKSYQIGLSLVSSDCIMSASPLYHSYAMGAAIMGAFTVGALLYTIDDFIPRKVIRAIDNVRISILYLVPFMAKMISEVSIKEEYDYSSLRIALVGAGPVTEIMNTNFKKRFHIDLSGNYGSTETGGMAIRQPFDSLKSIGKEMDGIKFKICSKKNESIPDGETGELWVKSPSMMNNYYCDQEIERDEEGYIPTGDIALKGEDGNFYIKGRKKMFIDIGSKKVNPYEVEEIIKKHPKVTECVVTSHVRKNNAIAIKAIVVGKQLEESELRAFCKQNINSYSVPSIIEIRDSIPKNGLGKIIRSNL